MRLILSILLSLLIAAACHAQQPRITNSAGPYTVVRCGLQDRSGLLWFGTSSDGIYRYDGKLFTHLTTKDGLPGNNISTMLQDKDGNIWIGGEGGLCRYSGGKFTTISLSVVDGRYFPITDPGATELITMPRSMMQDRDGKIWVGTNKGVYCYSGDRFTHFLENDNVANPNKLRLIETQSILQDAQGNIWFTTWFEGLCRYDGKAITQSKPNNEVWFSALAQDKQGNIWIGRRDKGMCRYDGTHFTNVMQHGNFDECGVNTIIVDKAGNLWIGTESGDLPKREEIGGAWRYDGKTFTNFTPKDGLPHYAVFCIVEDRAGGIWFGTRNSGLCRYNGKNTVVLSLPK